MKRTILIILSITLIILGFGLYRTFFFPDSDSIIEYYTNNEISHPETYLLDCENEDSLVIRFPLLNVNRITIAKGFFKFERNVDKNNFQAIINILNDSTSYDWGEITTFDPTFNMIFYDKDNKMIGIVIADKYCGQASFFPYLKKQKWGLFRQDKFNELKKLIDL